MRRKLFTVCSALSLLLMLAFCALWIRTRSAGPLDYYSIAEHHSYGVGTEPGAVIGFLQCQGPAYRSPDPADVMFDRAGARYYRITSDGMRRWNLVLPCWLPTAAAAVLPVAWTVRRVRDARRRDGLCPACGYDLRASPGRCPECGYAGPVKRNVPAGGEAELPAGEREE